MPTKKKARAPHQSVNGHVLTIKRLPKPLYMVIHGLKRGTRDATMRALLELGLQASKKLSPNWDQLARDNKLVLRVKR